MIWHDLHEGRRWLQSGSLKILEFKNIFSLTSGEIQTDVDCRGEFWKFENQDSEATDVDIKDGDIRIKRAFPDGRIPQWALLEVSGRWLSILSSKLRVKQ